MPKEKRANPANDFHKLQKKKEREMVYSFYIFKFLIICDFFVYRSKKEEKKIGRKQKLRKILKRFNLILNKWKVKKIFLETKKMN